MQKVICAIIQFDLSARDPVEGGAREGAGGGPECALATGVAVVVQCPMNKTIAQSTTEKEREGTGIDFDGCGANAEIPANFAEVRSVLG